MKNIMTIVAILALLAVSCLGVAYSLVSVYTDQDTGTGTIEGKPAYVTVGDWTTLKGDGSNSVSYTARDAVTNGKMHPEFEFSNITNDISSLGYLKITLTGTNPSETLTFYADVSDVDGSSVKTFKVIGTLMSPGTGDSGRLWTGTMSMEFGNSSASTMSALMGAGAKLSVTSYHLEGSE